ncbi:hypothetical protein KUTeg_016990 [Tegillarca granosa]|uniref:Uncharacterized protein n=1 Tax=Tegillarca granosa TaxID=220873 RepID=A0ABQ9ES84_TEGGR|nr:hypothetical protein KUTeg_016990 [Tegillarca granosa]
MLVLARNFYQCQYHYFICVNISAIRKVTRNFYQCQYHYFICVNISAICKVTRNFYQCQYHILSVSMSVLYVKNTGITTILFSLSMPVL